VRRQLLSALLVSIVAGGWPEPAAPAPLSADEVLTHIGLSATDKQRVLSGELVTADLPGVSERDLSVAVMAFLTKTSPESLSRQVMAGEMITADAKVQVAGPIKGAGSPADFAGLTITPDEARELAAARPGDALNLSAGESAALAGTPAGDAEAVRQQLHRILLARYQAYRTSGLAGIAPYDRGGGRTSDVAADLKKYLPGFHAVLLGYPTPTVPQLTESFFWIKSIVDDRATYVLSHLMAVPDGDARAVVRRQYYVSTRYNGEQAIAGFLPAQRGTVVVYAEHAFTDQVAGFGGRLKRGIGERMLARKLKEIFEAAREKATP
jgi:hypothetical protein